MPATRKPPSVWLSASVPSWFGLMHEGQGFDMPHFRAGQGAVVLQFRPLVEATPVRSCA